MDLDDAAAIGLTEMMYLKTQRQSNEDAAKRLCIGGQVLQRISSPIDEYEYYDPADHIKVSSFYEIDHSKFPPKSPPQLHLIRVVMVNEKTRMRVSLRFPSVYSLRAYFNEASNTNLAKPDEKNLPVLDEKYTMGSETAAEALYRRIPPQEISEKKNSWRFWVAPSISDHRVSSASPSNSGSKRVVVSKKGVLWSELKATGMVKWGKRRQVRFLTRHSDTKEEEEEEDNKMELTSEGDEEEEETEEDEEEEDEVKVDTKLLDSKRSYKRKRHGYKTQKKKRPRREKNQKKNQVVVYKKYQKMKKNKGLKNSIERWSAERYKLAEVNMLKVMKKVGAVIGKPILRAELRAEARKLIGDTGLLDHLLKHMAGKVAPGGKERFRRRHNADGAMEYWLEKADLMDIRQEAGVQDPFWTPPPGWKLGDNPTQDPVSAREIKRLKEEVAKMKKDMEELVSKKHEEELAIVTTPISCVTSQKYMGHDSLLTPVQERYIDLVNKKAKIEEKLMEISKSLREMEEEMEKLKTRLEDLNRIQPAERPALLMGSLDSLESIPSTGTERKGKQVLQQKKQARLPEEPQREYCNARGKTPATTKSPSPSEDKAAKIERLRSGFRLCKPQGTFLWPNMAISPSHRHVVVQLEDLLAVPTPPSASSTSATQSHFLLPSPPCQHHGLYPTSPPPVKPLAEKKYVTIAPSTVVTRPIPSPSLEITHNQYENISITTTKATTRSSLINLNEPPSNQNDNGFSGSGSQSHGHTCSYPVTYQRRNHPNVINTPSAMPPLSPAKKLIRYL